ncbi:MAG TPA: glycoside hydrolase family 36 protein [Nocardioides sp.]|nr:glycoside hydrolase family 36 protein [Nocardioides sp.]
MSYRTVDEVEVDAGRVRVYAEGWQSWSPTSWEPWGVTHRPGAPWEHAMRFRQGTELPVDVVHAEGLLVVDPGTGAPVRSYGVIDASEQVASLRAGLRGDLLTVAADGPVRATSHDGAVAALTAFGDAFATAAGVTGLRPPPRVWCSWYQYFENITAGDSEENATALDDHGLTVDVIQIDDGWSRGIGEWLEPSAGFPDMARLVGDLRATGRRVGIWLAPFFVGADSTVARQHPEWLTDGAGHNWHQDLRGLDLTHPGVREYLHGAVRRLAELGIDYFKLDFLYAGAIPARRRDDVSGIAAYRSGLELLRDAAGPDAYLVGCGAPILPSVGLVDAMRVSPDTFHEGGEDGSRGLRGRMSLVARAWQQGRFWVNDPDCLVVRPTYALREEWCRTVERFGGLPSCSDRVAALDEWGLEATRRLLDGAGTAAPFADHVVAAALESDGRTLA